MKSRFLLLLGFQFAFFSFCSAQGNLPSKVFLVNKYRHLESIDRTMTSQDFFPQMEKEMGLSDRSEMVLTKIINGENGYSHVKFEQFHGGIPVVGSTYVLHEKDGIIKWANGQFTPFIHLNLEPGLSASDALHYAKQAMNSLKYDEKKITANLCLIDPAYPEVSEKTLLAYEVEIHSLEPFDKQRFYVDAQNGEILSQFPMIVQHGVPSTAVTKYYGTQEIVTDSLAPNEFLLHDPTRGDGITVRDESGVTFTNNSSHWDLTNIDMDEVALDAHYCSQEYYDMMLSDFNWEGLDGEGGALLVNVHLDMVNAFWDGESSSYGDGNCIYGPLTTLEVVGHEFTHGMIDYTSNLIYSGESGAMNESMADIMGKTLEYHSDPGNFSWMLGHSFLLHEDAEPFRVMNDPASVGMPDYYKGDLWDDNSGVHTNSAIGNLWFHMLTDGKQGVNEAGLSYDVPSIGIEKASQIAFQTNRAYLIENSNYNDFYTYSLLAAEELYGVGALEIAAVEEAWKAVGLPNGGGGSQFEYDLSIRTPFRIEYTCTINEFIPVEVEVSNLGTEDYFPDFGANLILASAGLGTYEVAITDTILAGEILTVVVDDWLIVDEPGGFNLNIELDFDDQATDNNLNFRYFEVSEYTSLDIELFGGLRSGDCFSSVLNSEFGIRNNSCTPLPAGTTFDLTIREMTGGLLWSGEHVLTNELQPFQYSFAFIPVDLPSVAPQQDLEFEAQLDGDQNSSNNLDLVTSPSKEPVVGEYSNSFDSDILSDVNLEVRTILDPSVEYQGENYFGCTGTFQDYEFFSPCPEFEDNFDSNNLSNGVSGILTACTDLSMFNQPLLSFDVMQFRSDSAALSGNMHSCVLRVSWSGDGNGEEYIFGQNEGELYHYDLNLPANFKGELEFKLYTELGEFSVNQFAFEKYDVLLLDNLQITDVFTHTSEKEMGKWVSLSPNPSAGMVHIAAPKEIEMVELSSVDGKKIKDWKVYANQIDLNLNDYQSGIYLLRIKDHDGGWALEKLVLMNQN